MPDTTLDGTYVTICDWHGMVVWHSGRGSLIKPGDFAWQHLAAECIEPTKGAIARVVSLREEVTSEVHNQRGESFRVWLWPLQSPEIAVCILAVRVPRELGQLTNREREVLSCLALGKTTREIAEQLDVSASTVHTHMRRTREKLSLSSVEALTGFAARYCHPKSAPAPPLEEP